MLWAIICIVWGIGPILYILVGGGAALVVGQAIARSTLVAPAIWSGPEPSVASIARRARSSKRGSFVG